MKDEELKAIKYFEDKIKYYKTKIEELKQQGKTEGIGTEIDTYKLKICNTQILLNLIAKQYKKIEKIEEYIRQEIWLCEHDIEACTGNDEDTRRIFVIIKERYEEIQNKMLED